MEVSDEQIEKIYNLGVDDAVNYCGYNTTVMQMIKPSKRKEFMKEYPRPKFKKLNEIKDKIFNGG